MPGERRGITWEALVTVALEGLVQRGEIRGPVTGNVKLAGMRTTPDLILGPTERPHTVVLVTHTTSASNSHMKTWRNLGELQEIKTTLPGPPRVVSVVFQSGLKRALRRLSAHMLDGQLLVSERPYGAKLTAWVRAHSSHLPGPRVHKIRTLRTLLDGPNPPPIDGLAADLRKLVRARRRAAVDLWGTERTRATGQSTKARESWVRRGLARLLVFEDTDLALRLFQGERLPVSEVPDYALTCALARRTLAGVRADDDEAMDAVSMLGSDRCREILHNAPRERMAPWLSTLRQAPVQAHLARWVVAQASRLVEPGKLTEDLLALHADPHALAAEDAPTGWPPANVWLLEALMALLQLASGRRSGYGYARLARDVADAHGPAGHLPESVRTVLLSPWGHLSSWLRRDPRGNLDPQVIGAVAQVLSHHLQALGKRRLKRLAAQLPGRMVDAILDNKLVSYRGFDPLGTLVQQVIPNAEMVRIQSCFAEAAGLAKGTGTTRIARCGRTLIRWQSAYGSHTNDKRRELTGRALALRYHWDGQAFAARPGVDRLILLVDGSWRQGDLDRLAGGGWDHVFRPDQLEALAAAVI